MSAIQDIKAERQRQINMEGWTAAHDDRHDEGDLALAALCYVYASIFDPGDFPDRYWPWDRKWWKPGDNRRNLVKAGALIIAEIQRMDREAGLKPDHTCNSQYVMRELPDPECPACTLSVPPHDDKSPADGARAFTSQPDTAGDAS